MLLVPGVSGGARCEVTESVQGIMQWYCMLVNNIHFYVKVAYVVSQVTLLKRDVTGYKHILAIR